VTVWGSDVFVTARESPVARAWAWAALRGASLVTADSNDLAEAAIDLGARRQRLRIIQFGVETSRFTPGPASAELRKRLGLERTRIMFVPRSIAPIYHTLTAVEAMLQLPDDVSLVLTAANAEAPYLDAVRDRIRALQLEDRVRIVDGIEHAEMVDYYRLADVVVSIPQSDGTPVSVLEAMSCGRTVIATDLPSVREWLAPVTPSLLVPPGDAAATAAAIVRALAPDDDQLGPRLREIVIERADHERNMTEMEGEYLALAGRRS
jgi:glycosyltransferase involved in cell wall biosynthesis